MIVPRIWRGARAPGRGDSRHQRRSRSRRPVCEGLEGRTLLATAGTDYALSGYRWSNPAHVTYSIVPDGTPWGGGASDLNATFDAKLGASWRREVARALATWEAVA